ncbi:MAG: hypothetical protein O7D30_11155, partial [Rickettsia endosymbiont of Ixodes persulcatus]|nr:hypothetical protein [Rickettsia endosymbiont of Ixodes persulcatus]
ADNCVIYRQIRNLDDALQLQRDLDSITAWCTDWQMMCMQGCRLLEELSTGVCSSIPAIGFPYPQ